MSNKENDSTTFIIGAAVGGLVCAGLALLLVPRSKKHSYDDEIDDREFASCLCRKGQKFTDDVKHVASDFKDGNYGDTIKEVLELVSKGLSLWQNLSNRR